MYGVCAYVDAAIHVVDSNVDDDQVVDVIEMLADQRWCDVGVCVADD